MMSEGLLAFDELAALLPSSETYCEHCHPLVPAKLSTLQVPSLPLLKAENFLTFDKLAALPADPPELPEGDVPIGMPHRQDVAKRAERQRADSGIIPCSGLPKLAHLQPGQSLTVPAYCTRHR